MNTCKREWTKEEIQKLGEDLTNAIAKVLHYWDFSDEELESAEFINFLYPLLKQNT